MDALSETPKVLHPTSGIFLDADFTAPWVHRLGPQERGVRPFPPEAEQVVIFHLVVEGACRARLPEDGTAIDLAAGDLIMFPTGTPHPRQRPAAASAAGGVPGPPRRLGQRPMRIRHGGSGLRTQFICGYMARDKRLCCPYFRAAAHVKVSLRRRSDHPLDGGGAAARRPGDPFAQPGREAVMGRLAELFFRRGAALFHPPVAGKPARLAGGLRDPYVGKAWP